MYSKLKSYFSHSKISQKLLLMLLTTSLVTAVIVLFTTFSIWRFIIHTQVEPDYLDNLTFFAEQQPNIHSLKRQLKNSKLIAHRSIHLHLISIFDEQGDLVSKYGADLTKTNASAKSEHLHQQYADYLNNTPFTPTVLEINLRDGSHYTLLVVFQYKMERLFNGKFLLMVIALVLTAILLIRIILIRLILLSLPFPASTPFPTEFLFLLLL